MTEFITWAYLLTEAGALAMVLLLTQFTKDFGFIDKIPTQLWSYVLSVVVLGCALGFTGGLSADTFVQMLFNAVIISVSANGTYSAITRITQGASTE